MYIAVTAEGENLNSKISQTLENCKYLLIINLSDFNIVAIKNEGVDSGEKLANEVLKYDCEAIITGKLNPSVFDILADVGVTRYLGVGYFVEEAIDLMERYLLKFIRNHEGTDECDGNHHWN